jgi:putative flippase GtrA
MPGKQPEFVRRFLGTEFIRYFVSGSIAFIFDFSVLVFCTEVLGIHYLYSNIAGYAVGLIVSYIINITWVFDHRRFDGRQRREFVYFTFIVLVGLATSELVLWLVTESIELPYTWAKVVSAFFVFLFNFVAKKWLLFSPIRH